MNKSLMRYLLISAALLSAPMASAADEHDDEDGEPCISANVLRQTRIINDATILFYLSGSKIYRNDLPRSCPGLAREGRFSYRRTTSSLCRNDFIQVLGADAGGFRGGRTCALGNFYRMTEDDVDLLLNPADSQPPPLALPPSEPEEVVPEDAGEEPDEPGSTGQR